MSVKLTSLQGDIIAGASAGGKAPLNIDFAKNTFNGQNGNYISVWISGLKTRTLELLSTHDYASSLKLSPFDRQHF